MFRQPSLKPFIRAAILSLATQVAIAAQGNPVAQAGFEGAAPGPFTVLSTPEGEWSAAAGHAQINTEQADLGKRCLHIIGGADRSIELQLNEPSQNKILKFVAERWTGKPPFSFRVSGRTAGEWKELYNGDKRIAVGGFDTKASIVLLDGTDRLRLTCTAKSGAGILIDDLRIIDRPEHYDIVFQQVPEKADEAPFQITRKVINKPGQFLQSYPGITLPEDAVVQGSEIHYTVTASAGRPFRTEDFTYTYGFSERQGNVEFKGTQGGNNNFFKADWYGENLVTIAAKHKDTGETTILTNSIVCHFASRQVLGGNGDDLPEDYRNSIRRGDIHDINAVNKGMAYLPADFSRGDTSSEQIRKGFYETTEPRMFQTKKGTLIASVQARRIGKNDAPPGQGIVVKRSTDHGATWTDGLLLDQNGNDLWGYTAFVEVDGTIYCYAVAGHPSHQGANQDVRGIFYFTSTDEGKTWSTRIRHDQLSAALGFTAGSIPAGSAPNCNILVVPGLTLDGKEAPEGRGLLLSTYASGYIWASIDGGQNWSKVAYCKHYANAGANGYDKPVQIENELAWCTLDNDEGDIYMIWRRQASSGYKNEYLVSRHFKTGENGMAVKGLYNQDLQNVRARRCHFGMRRIPGGKDKSKLLLATQGSGSRSHIRLGVSRETVTGANVTSGLFDKVTVMQGIGWGYCDIEYISAEHPAHKGLGKDGILLLGESEPIHTQTYQYIPLKPAGKGRNERYTATAYMLSMEYFQFLNRQSL